MKHSIKSAIVPRETFRQVDELWEQYQSKIKEYIDLLLWWNDRVNLVSRDVSRGTVAAHVRHSLLLHSVEEFKKADYIVDAGTGGGLPGIPLAITHPDKTFLLNDIVTKKAMAVRQMCRKLTLNNIETFDGSISEVNIEDPFLLISKHAFKVNNLIQLTEEMPWKSIIFYKGIDFHDELDGIEESVSIETLDLSQGGAFYEDKAIVILSR